MATFSNSSAMAATIKAGAGVSATFAPSCLFYEWNTPGGVRVALTSAGAMRSGGPCDEDRGVRVGLGRVAVSEIAIPNLVVNLV
jgi:hypothetical protein